MVDLSFFLVSLGRNQEAHDWLRCAQTADPENKRIKKNLEVVKNRIKASKNTG